MNEIQYNDFITLKYEYIPVYATASLSLGTKYKTKIYTVSRGNNYPIGEENGKLDEEMIKLRYEEMMTMNRERNYGQFTQTLRKDLTPIRERGQAGTAEQRRTHSRL